MYSGTSCCCNDNNVFPYTPTGIVQYKVNLTLNQSTEEQDLINVISIEKFTHVSQFSTIQFSLYPAWSSSLSDELAWRRGVHY